MRAYRFVIALVVVTGLVFLTAWVMGWPAERAIYLAPVIVIGFAAAAGLVILWGKVAIQQLRETRRPRLVLALWIAGIGLIVLLSVLGVELPREGELLRACWPAVRRPIHSPVRCGFLDPTSGGPRMRFSLTAAAALAACVAAFAAP